MKSGISRDLAGALFSMPVNIGEGAAVILRANLNGTIWI